MASTCLRSAARPSSLHIHATAAASRIVASHISPACPPSRLPLRLSSHTSLSSLSPPCHLLPSPSPSPSSSLLRSRPSSSLAARAAVSAPPEAAPSTGAAAPKPLQDPEAQAVLQRLEKIPQPWQWQPQPSISSQPIPIHSVLFQDPAPAAGGAATPSATLPPSSPAVLLLPAFSDVSTVDEWAAVAACLLAKASSPSPLGKLLRTGGPGGAEGSLEGVRVVSLDWPGFGASGSPPLLYTADFMEDFLVDYVAHLFQGSDLSQPLPLVVLGGGHAASIALRAISKGRMTPAAVGAVAPTWAGPLPVVFGNDEKMTFRYSLLRNTIRTPGLGWGLYQYLTSPKMLTMQYKTHVYADPENVLPNIIERGTELTNRENSRFAPASFVSGLLDPTKTREEFLGIVEAVGRKGVPVGVVVPSRSPKRSKKEMESLQGSPGVTGYAVCKGALLPQEEYPEEVVQALDAALGC